MEQTHSNPIIAITLAIGTFFGGLSLLDIDIIMGLFLKGISILSFSIGAGYGIWKWRVEYLKNKKDGNKSNS